MKNIVALEGRPLPEWTPEEKAVYETLSQANGWLSALGLSRWIMKNPDLTKPDKKIAAAADKLWKGMMILQDTDGNYSLSDTAQSRGKTR